MLELCPAGCGPCFWLAPRLLGAMVWLGPACLKPCSGKLRFGRFWGPFCLWRRFRRTNF